MLKIADIVSNLTQNSKVVKHQDLWALGDGHKQWDGTITLKYNPGFNYQSSERGSAGDTAITRSMKIKIWNPIYFPSGNSQLIRLEEKVSPH